MEYLYLDTVDSTNNYAKQHAATLASGTAVCAREQTAGRGQRGNRWLAVAGENATFSIFFRPHRLRAIDQQAISETAALAVADTLVEMSIDNVRVKWPNDIYVDDRKIAGILIECSLEGAFVEHAVVGIGLNVNQTCFPSELPNPTSVAIKTRHQHDPDRLIRRICENFERLWERVELESREPVHDQYISRLYRNDGKPHPFALPDGTRFDATIADVALSGPLRLRHADGSLHDYAFKEVEFIV